MAIVQKNAEPFFFPGGDTGCLLVHGFTGSPSEMRYLGEFLAKQGFTVLGVRLAGHGTSPEDMAGTTWPDWYESVRQAWLELRQSCGRLFIIGLSMGGLLTLHASLEFPAAGIVAINTPVFLQNRNVLFTPVLKHVIAYTGKTGLQLADNQFAYDKMPLKCIESLLSLISTVRTELPRLNAPLLVLQSDQDKTVRPKSADYIFRTASSVDKEITRFPKSGHLLTIGIEREQAAVRVFEFINQHV